MAYLPPGGPHVRMDSHLYPDYLVGGLCSVCDLYKKTAAVEWTSSWTACTAGGRLVGCGHPQQRRLPVCSSAPRPAHHPPIAPLPQVPPNYDSLLGKLIVWGENRDAAINRMKRALNVSRGGWGSLGAGRQGRA